MTQRFALYAAPAARDPLHEAAATWLGWDPESGESHPPATVPGLPAARIAALTADPRLYGFHGTLKPPFRLAAGHDDGQLIMALERFAATRAAIRLPPLQVAALGDFLALRPSAPCPMLDELAADCVRDFDRFRAPASDQELARRRRHGLSERQERHLADWGYPYVLEDFRLHFTLTGRTPDAAERLLVQRHLETLFARYTRHDFVLDEICLFVQGGAGAPFRIAGRYRLGG